MYLFIYPHSTVEDAEALRFYNLPEIIQLPSSGDEIQLKGPDPKAELLTVVSEGDWLVLLFPGLWSVWFAILASHYNHMAGISKDNLISGGWGPILSAPCDSNGQPTF